MANYSKFSRGQKHLGGIAVLIAVFVIFYYVFFHKGHNHSTNENVFLEERHNFISWDNHVQGIFYRVIVPENFNYAKLQRYWEVADPSYRYIVVREDGTRLGEKQFP